MNNRAKQNVKRVTIVEPLTKTSFNSSSPFASRPLSAFTDTFSEKTSDSNLTTKSKITPAPVIQEEDGDGGDNVIVSDLPSETLRWMKKRRDINSSKKIVISFYRENQLREIFDKLDYQKHKALDLDDLTEAIRYVKKKMSRLCEFPHLNNMEETFRDMDDNGDGTVDFEEFSRGMTGTTNSTFDMISEYDLNRFLNFFMEFGEMKQRENAINRINETIFYQQRTKLDAIKKENSVSDIVYDNNLTENFSFHEEKDDLENYQYFKILFNIKDPQKEKKQLGAQSSTNNLFKNSTGNISGVSSFLASPTSSTPPVFFDTDTTPKPAPACPLAASVKIDDKSLFHGENINNLGKEHTNYQEEILNKFCKIQKKVKSLEDSSVLSMTEVPIPIPDPMISDPDENEEQEMDEGTKMYDLKTQIENDIFFSNTSDFTNPIVSTSPQAASPFQYRVDVNSLDPEVVYESLQKRMKDKRLEMYENRLESFGSLVLQKKRDMIRK